MDLESMSNGRWTPQIEKAIQESTDVVILISRAAAASAIMEKEASLAASLGRPLVPVLVEEIGGLPPDWLKKVLEHQAAKLDPLDSVVTVDRIVRLLSSKPGRAREFLRPHSRKLAGFGVAVVLLAGITLIPTQFNNANIRPHAVGAIRMYTAMDPTDLRTKGGTLTQHGQPINGIGKWYFLLRVWPNDSLSEQSVNQGGVELAAEFSPNLLLSVRAKPGPNIKTIDVRGCDFALIAHVATNEAQFWHPADPPGGPEVHSTRISLAPWNIRLAEENLIELRQVGRKAVGFINGNAVGEMQSPHSFASCPPRVFFKTSPTAEATAQLFDIRVLEFPSRWHDYLRKYN